MVAGAPVVGYGFGSFGRYAQGGLIRERFSLVESGRVAPPELPGIGFEGRTRLHAQLPRLVG